MEILYTELGTESIYVWYDLLFPVRETDSF